jgi:hypothetical protein
MFASCGPPLGFRRTPTDALSHERSIGLPGPDDVRVVSHPRWLGFEDPKNLVADVAKTSFACHLSQKAIYDIFDTYLHQSEL